MEKLPLEITENILFSLRMDSRLQCREVCRTWRTLLPKPKRGLLYGVPCRNNKASDNKIYIEFYFSEEKSDEVVNTRKLDHSLIMPASITDCFMVGSCNGLVCYATITTESDDQYDTDVYVCNPVTGENIQLPRITWKGYGSPRTASVGFGYIHSTKEYKVVSIQCGRYNNRDQKVVQVYNLRGGVDIGWRNITVQRGIMPNFSVLPSAGVFTGGALHWMDLESFKLNPIAFNLKHETFEFLPQLDFDKYDTDTVGLMELGGNLCVVQAIPSRESREIRVYELRQRKIAKYEPYWHTKFTLAWKDYSWFEPSDLLDKCEKCLFFCNVILSCYDPQTKTLRKLEETLKKLKEKEVYVTDRVTPHTNSVVSLNSMNEITEKRDPNKRKAPVEKTFRVIKFGSPRYFYQ